MGRSNAGEYYSDNLRRLLRDEEQKRAASPAARGVRDVKPRDFESAHERSSLKNGMPSRPAAFSSPSRTAQRADIRSAPRPKVPEYGASSYRIGDRDERAAAGKIDGIYGRRSGVQAVQSGRTPAAQGDIRSTAGDRTSRPRQDTQASQAARTGFGQAGSVYGRASAVRPQKPVQDGQATRRSAAVRSPSEVHTGGMSYDARSGGEIKSPPRASSYGASATNMKASAADSKGDAGAKNGKKTNRNAVDAETEAEIRENRRLYREYIERQNSTMPRAERDRQRMDAYYAAQSSRRARRLREFLILSAAFFVTLGLICTIVYKFLFVITEITVTGETVADTAGISEAAGVRKGDNLYSFSASAVNSAVTLRYPVVKSVAVKRSIPNKVTFTVTDDKAVFYAQLYGEYRLFSASLRVMGETDAESAAAAGLIKLKLPAVSYAVDGRDIIYASDRSGAYVRKVLDTLLASELSSRVTSVDVTRSYDVTMVSDGKYLLRFGECEEMDIKMRIAAAVLSDSMFSGGNKASVDLTDTSQTSVIIDNQLVLD